MEVLHILISALEQDAVFLGRHTFHQKCLPAALSYAQEAGYNPGEEVIAAVRHRIQADDSF